MDDRPRLIFSEEFHLDDLTARAVRQRIGSFAPLLGGATSTIQIAATEVTTAFARLREPDSSIEFRLFDNHQFRVEFANTLSADYLLSADDDGERFMRRHILDEATDRWGVLGNGAAIVWFEVANVTPAKEIS